MNESHLSDSSEWFFDLNDSSNTPTTQVYPESKEDLNDLSTGTGVFLA